jgi:hypothetical protein
VSAEEVEAAGLMRRRQLLQDQPAEQAREHAYGQEKARPAGDPSRPVEREAATRHDAMDMWVMGERGTPGMQNGSEADPGPEMLGVGGDGDQRLGCGLEKDGIDLGLVLIGDVSDWCRQRENHMIVGHRQELGLAVDQPCLRRGTLALRAMAVAAGVVGDAGVVAVLAARDMTAERRGAAALDRRHDLQLAEAHMAGIGAAPGGPVVAEDIRDLQSGPDHGRRGLGGRLGSPGAQRR